MNRAPAAQADIMLERRSKINMNGIFFMAEPST